jgi:hypothetical protein
LREEREPVAGASKGVVGLMPGLTLAQHQRLDALPDDFHVVGWDDAWQSPTTAGPLVEDSLDHHICRLTPRGKLMNNPSSDALEQIVRRRESLHKKHVLNSLGTKILSTKVPVLTS